MKLPNYIKKQRIKSQRETNSIIRETYKWISILCEINKKCKECNSRKNLEIHHERYPTTSKGIKILIKKRKIYYLCRKCHRKKHKNI